MTLDAGSAPAPERRPHTPAAEMRVFSLSERIGRVRYLVYFLAAAFACSAVFYVIYAFTRILPPAPAQLLATLALIFVKYLALPVIFCILTIRRLHDFNASGWWSLAVFIPLVAFVFLAIPGSKLDNRYGPPPPPNGEFLNIAAVLAPILLAWVTVQAYQKREAAAQISQQIPRYAPPANPTGRQQPLRPYVR